MFDFDLCFMHMLVSVNDHMVQALSRRPAIAEARVQSQARPCGICGARSGTGIRFSPSSSVFPCQYHSASATYWAIHCHRSQGCINPGRQVTMILNGA